MQKEHNNRIRLDLLVHKLPDAKLLRKDCTVLNNTCIRFMYEVCARDKYSSNSVSAQTAVRGLLQGLCDNKPVEDIQTGQVARIAKHANQRSTASEIQERIVSSNVLSSRSICHPTGVTRDHFCAKYSKNYPKTRKHRYQCNTHQLHLEFTKVMGIKRRVSPTPASDLNIVSSWY